MSLKRPRLSRDSIRRDGEGALLGTGVGFISQIDVGDAQVLGVQPTAAPLDHQHALPVPAAPPSVGATNSAGVSTKVAREDHQHQGVGSVEALVGAVTISSPMKKITGQDIRIDNGNSKTLPGAPVQADIDTEVNTDFIVAKLAAAATTIPKPKVPLNNFEGRKITFTITSRGTANDAVTFTTGADGYVWATQLGPLQADFDALVAGAPNNSVIEVGCKYSTALGKWMIVALAGYFA